MQSMRCQTKLNASIAAASLDSFSCNSIVFVFAKYCKRAYNYGDTSSCISSKEELVAKQLVSRAMVTMNRGTTVCVRKKKSIKFKMTEVSLCSSLS